MYVALIPPQTPMEGVKNPTMAKIEHVLTVSGILQHKYCVNMGLISMCYANLKI